jgi:hypothetical protein
MAFGFTLPAGLRFLQKFSWPLLALTGTIAGAGSYWAGEKLGAVRFGHDLLPSLLFLGLVWAIWLPVAVRISQYHRRPDNHSNLLIYAVFCTLLQFPFAAKAASTEDLFLIGKAVYKYMLWNVYDASLHAASKEFDYPNTFPFVLTLAYHRDLDKQQIIDETVRQWQHQEQEVPEAWIGLLEDILPDVSKHDSLSFYVDDAFFTGTLFHNERLISRIVNQDFNIAFVGIWLSVNTSYPEHRQQLLGKKP